MGALTRDSRTHTRQTTHRHRRPPERSYGGFMGLAPRAGPDRNNVAGIADVEHPLGVFDAEVVAADHDKLRMQPRELPASGSANEERALSHQLRPNQVTVHAPVIDSSHQPGKRPPERGGAHPRTALGVLQASSPASAGGVAPPGPTWEWQCRGNSRAGRRRAWGGGDRRAHSSRQRARDSLRKFSI